MPPEQTVQCVLGLWLVLKNPMLEVEPASQRGLMTTGSGRKDLDLGTVMCSQYLANKDK